MYNSKAIETIKRLLHENTEASLTYAALECRLAIEVICYQRLRSAHDYISHDDLRAWQPRQIIDTLIREVDPRASTTFTLSMSEEHLEEGSPAPTAEQYAKMSWVEVGTQVGFDPKKLGKMWNKLANTALHVTLPKTSSDEVRRYGDRQRIRDAVVEALDEIERIDSSTLSSAGFGEMISFECGCGSVNKRRSALLSDKSIVSCINPNCYESYVFLSDVSVFQKRKFDFNCKSCGKITYIPTRYMEKELKIGTRMSVTCECGNKIYVQWNLMQADNSALK